MKPKIRLALMTSTIDGRLAKGTAVVARKCVETLLKHRDEFELTFIHYERFDDEIYQHGVREIIIPEFRFRVFNRRSLRFMYFILTTREQFDIMHWFQPRLYPFFWRAPATHLVVTVHGAGDVTAYNRFNAARHVFNWTLILWRKQIDIAIAGSSYAARDIAKYYRFEARQIRVIHNGADDSFKPASRDLIRAVRSKYDLPESFFLGVGRLIPIKNVVRCLQAFEMYCNESGDTRMHYVNVGATGTELPLVGAFLKKSRVRERVHVIRYVEQADLPGVYGAAFALVFPLLNEGFGLPAIEAMACGTPTVVSETARPEITGRDAVLVDALDVRDVARGMKEIMDPKRNEEVKRNGFVLAKKFTWAASADAILAVYRELMR